MKDLFVTFCWTIVIILFVGVLFLIGWLCSLCPEPSFLVKSILAICGGFIALFIIVHGMRHDPFDGLFDDIDSPD